MPSQDQGSGGAAISPGFPPPLVSPAPPGTNTPTANAATQQWVSAHFGQTVSVSSKNYLAVGKVTGSVSTTGTTFAAGADLMSSALSFRATGSDNYIVSVRASDWQNSGAGNANDLRLNLDGADAGYIAIMSAPGANYAVPCAGSIILTPTQMLHTVNVRLTCSAGTAMVNAGAGGAGTRGPIIITIELA